MGRNNFRCAAEQCRVGRAVEAWVSAVLIMGVVAGAIIGITLVEMRGGR